MRIVRGGSGRLLALASWLTPLLISSAGGLGCGGEAKPADSPSPAASGSAAPSSAPSAEAPAASATPSSATAATPAASAAPAAAASPLSTVLTTDPQKLTQMYAAANSAAVASTAAGGAGDASESGLKALGTKQAAGMRPDGAVAKGTLQEGGHLEMLVTLQAGKCYSILGYSPVPGVKDLDLHLLAPPFYNVLSGEDTTDDNTPIVGKTPNAMCPAMTVAMPYKVDIFADKGAGAVAVQLYSKAK